MKKILVLMVLLSSAPIFAQEKEAKIDTSYTRFGMNVLPLGYGLGASLDIFPLSFYVANDLNQILSFGLNVGLGFNYLRHLNTLELNLQLGGFFGFGKMKATSYNSNLHVGYLIEFGAGYASNAPWLPGFYISFTPNFILEIDQFLFKVGVYVDTSMIITARVGFGFLLK
ncbi:MAG: hypothetical protein ACRCWI_03345 [Brevinema sp.]